MATVNLGSIKFKWKGTYSGATAYTVDDVVEYNGSSYICKLASTGNLPTNTTYFDVMSSAGTNGTDLGTTLTTQGDLLYRDGSGLQRLGAGTAGQVLQTGGAGANPSWTNITNVDSQQLVQAWLNYDGDTNTIRDSKNISSVTDNGAGNYTANFSITFANNDYAMAGVCSYQGGTNDHFVSQGTYGGGYTDGSDMTTTSCAIRTIYSGAALQDVEIVTVIWTGEVA